MSRTKLSSFAPVVLLLALAVMVSGTVPGPGLGQASAPASSPSDARCPHCGSPIAKTASPEAIAIPASTTNKLAQLVVQLPAEAKLEIQGVMTELNGESRSFVSPPLEFGRIYRYFIVATWNEQGKSVVRRAEAVVKAGQETKVDLRDSTACQYPIFPLDENGLPGDRPATVVVRVPRNATLQIDGTHVQVTGGIYRFYTVPMAADDKIKHEFRASWIEGHLLISSRQILSLWGGKTVDLDLRTPTESSILPRSFVSAGSTRPSSGGAEEKEGGSFQDPDFPPYEGELSGKNKIIIDNPNEFTVKVGLRSRGRGKNFSVSPGQTKGVPVPEGDFEAFFKYSTEPKLLYRGDPFTVRSGEEHTIRLVKVPHGNYQIVPVEERK